MSDYFPADIWTEILLKLPVESLIRFTTVCKSWRSLILSPDFIYAHLSHSKNHSILRRYDEHEKHDHYLPLHFIVTGNNGSYVICADRNPEIPFISENGRYGIVGSCDGIVCLSNSFFYDSSPAVILWNPSVRNHVVLPQAYTNPRADKVLLGFGVANHVYKVIRLVYCWKSLKYVPPLAEIFSLGTDRWRSVSGFDSKLEFPIFMWRQVMLNGIVHWLGFETIGDRSYRISILTFDMGYEVFGEVMLPDAFALTWKPVTEMYLCKIGGSLAVLKYDPSLFSRACDVWVMKEYGVTTSWTKLYSIGFAEECKNEDIFFDVVGFKNGEALLAYALIERNLPNLFSYNLETKLAMDLEISGTPRSLYIGDYVESLLLLKGNSVPAVEEIGEPLMEVLDINKV